MLTRESNQIDWTVPQWTSETIEARLNSLSSSAKLLLKIVKTLKVLGGQANSELDRVLLDERARKQLVQRYEPRPAPVC